MNTVEDLRQALSEEVRRLQPPDGLETRVFQQALRSSAAVVPEHRAGRRGAVRSPESRSVEIPRFMTLVAALLAVAIVLGLVFAARALHLVGFVPSSPDVATTCTGTSHVAQPSPLVPTATQSTQPVAAPPIPAEDLQFAGLSDAALITPLHVEGKYVDHTVTLIGAYADPARIVLILQVKPNDAQPPFVSVTDDQGELNASGGGGPTGTGDFVWHVDAGPRVGADGIAHLKAGVRLDLPKLPQGTTVAQLEPLVLKFDLRVHKSTLLPVGAPFHLGRWTVTIKTLEVTPATIHLDALFEGASSDDLLGPSHLDLITVLDETCAPLRSVAGSTTIASGGYDVHFQWMRPPSAATYQLRFHGNGATHTMALKVPASGTI